MRNRGGKSNAKGGLNVGERGGGDEAHSERAGQVAVLATALVAQVQRVLLLTLVGVAEHHHLTQERVHDHVLVVDLTPKPGEPEPGSE